MRRAGLVLCALLSISTFMTIEAFACTCELPAPGRTTKQLTKNARSTSAVVVSGEVLEILQKSDLKISVRIRIKSRWKGSRATELNIFTGRGGGDCGFRFEVGSSYLIYARKTKAGLLTTSICDRTKRLSEAWDDIQVLGKEK